MLTVAGRGLVCQRWCGVPLPGDALSTSGVETDIPGGETQRESVQWLYVKRLSVKC